MAQPSTRQPAPSASKQTLNPAPFVFERGDHGAPRAWHPSKPTDKTREQITVALGQVWARIAGSTVTYPMDVQIVFADKTAAPDVILRQPWQSAPGGRGGNPLFQADTDRDGAALVESLNTITDRFIEYYRMLPKDSAVNLDTLDYATAVSLIKAKAGSVRRTLARPNPAAA